MVRAFRPRARCWRASKGAARVCACVRVRACVCKHVCVRSGIRAAHRSAEAQEGPARDAIRLGPELEDATDVSGHVGHGGGGRQGAAQNDLG